MDPSPSGWKPASCEKWPEVVEFDRELYCAAPFICPIIPPMFEVLILFVVLLVIFGASKLRNAGSDLGAAVKGFRKAVRPPEPPGPAEPDAEFPEVTADKARGSDKPGA